MRPLVAGNGAVQLLQALISSLFRVRDVSICLHCACFAALLQAVDRQV
jgi:hypothetical protein